MGDNPLRLWLVTQFYPPDGGASAVRLSRLARLLAEQGHDVTVLTVMPHYWSGTIAEPYRGRLFMREMLDGVTVLRAWLYASPSKRARARLLNQISAMLTVALRGTFARRPDAILLESHPLFMALAGGWLRRIKGAPVVLNVSDLWPESAVETGVLRADSLLVRLAIPVERWAYRDAAQIVGMTEGVVAGIRRAGADPDKISLITNGVDLARFRPGAGDRRALRDRFGIPPDQIVALHVGNMSTTYDFAPILESAAVLPEIAFLFVGSGTQEPALRAEASERALSNIHFAGVLPHDQMPDAWAAGDLCLISMGDHGLSYGTRPAKLYEALASGMPVIAAIRGEGAALLNDAGAGIVVPIGDSAAMREAIHRLAGDSAKRAASSQSGRAYAEMHLSPERVRDAYLEVIRRAVHQALMRR
ncbi:MAG: glycosyltransferase family 4 protein [Anaerolineae bacterium]|nr:glycosyltransferase family 4 protein [Anaerolineae bacterium]